MASTTSATRVLFNNHRLVASLLSRRQFSSSTSARPAVGAIKRRPKMPPSRAASGGGGGGGGGGGARRRGADPLHGDEGYYVGGGGGGGYAGAQMSSGKLAQNVLLAAGLLGFCGGVFYYGLRCVGQAGMSGSVEDPLAVLQKEAAAQREVEKANDMKIRDASEFIEKVNRGDFDPEGMYDVTEDDEDDEDEDDD